MLRARVPFSTALHPSQNREASVQATDDSDLATILVDPHITASVPTTDEPDVSSIEAELGEDIADICNVTATDGADSLVFRAFIPAMTGPREELPGFRTYHVARLGPSLTVVRWSIFPTAWDLDDLTYVIFRSEGPEGPWDEVGEAPEGLYQWADSEIHGLGVDRPIYYIVRMASKSGYGYLDSKPITLEHDPDHIAMELVRKKNLSLKVKNGVECGILLKRRSGPKCSRCYNFEQGAPTDADCPECMGTGFTGGFLAPILIPGTFHVTDRMLVRAGIKFATQNIVAEIANYPYVDVGDIVVDLKMNIRYRIDNVHTTYHRSHTISQFLNLTRVDERDVVYTIELPEPAFAPYGRSFDMVNRANPQLHDLLSVTPNATDRFEP